MSNIINQVDPTLLRQQRNDLLDVIEGYHQNIEAIDIDVLERLDGLVHLLDQILDIRENTEEEFNPRWVDPYENIGMPVE
tara:strand:- start:1470 stop:1709 length:240 start_codon:yes stop_codon:yes gene_type:complete